MGGDAATAWKQAGSVFFPVSDRLLRVRLKIHTGFVSIIAVYAPTNEPGCVEESEKFYQLLQECVDEVPKHDMLIVMGDFNARVGNDVGAWHDVIGRFGPQELNENGERLLEFCSLNGLVVTNTVFQHRSCHQLTWFHPAESGGVGHTLDYVLVHRRFRSSILDTRIYRKVYLQSDHRLVVSRVRLKLRAGRKRARRHPRVIVNRKLLQQQQVQQFQRVLEEGWKTQGSGDVEQAWSEFKTALLEVQSTLPLTPEEDSGDWVTEGVHDVARRKQEAWLRWTKNPDNTILKESYQQLKRQSRLTADVAWEAWWRAKAEEAEYRHEVAISEGRGGSTVRELRLLKSSQKLRVSTALLAADGKTRLTSSSEKLDRWQEHFCDVCNIPSAVTDQTLEAIPEVTQSEVSQTDNETLSMVSREEEIREAIGQLKSGRAPGEDMIVAELLKLGEETVVKWLTELAVKVWDTEDIPYDWKKQLTVPLHKKGVFDKCDNYRGIALLSVPGKVFCRVLQRRLARRAEGLLSESQCGFRSGCGCLDQVFMMRILAEKAREFNTPLYLCFVDLRKAYDSVNRQALWAVLRRRYCSGVARECFMVGHVIAGAYTVQGGLGACSPRKI